MTRSPPRMISFRNLCVILSNDLSDWKTCVCIKNLQIFCASKSSWLYRRANIHSISCLNFVFCVPSETKLSGKFLSQVKNIHGIITIINYEKKRSTSFNWLSPTDWRPCNTTVIRQTAACFNLDPLVQARHLVLVTCSFDSFPNTACIGTLHPELWPDTTLCLSNYSVCDSHLREQTPLLTLNLEMHTCPATVFCCFGINFYFFSPS